MVGFEKALGAVKVIKDQIQYRSQSLLKLAVATLGNTSPRFSHTKVLYLLARHEHPVSK